MVVARVKLKGLGSATTTYLKIEKEQTFFYLNYRTKLITY